MPAPTPPFRPHADLVVKGWLLGVPGLPPAGVSADLPRDQAAWAERGFVTYSGPVGGSPNSDVPMRDSVFQVDCWAVAPSSGKPPWGMANQLAELIVADVYPTPGNPAQGRRGVVLPANYVPAAVHSAVVLTEPRRMRGDEGSYARYQLDLQLWWSAVAS